MKILVVDDHVLFREGLASLLDSQPDLTVIGSAETGEAAIDQARELKPDLVLMDFSLPGGTCLDTTKTILFENPDAKIVILTIHDEDYRLVEVVRNGATGYIPKNVRVSKLLSYIRGLEQGGRIEFPYEERPPF